MIASFLSKISMPMVAGFIAASLIAAPSFAQDRREVVRQILAESQAAYPGNCPCPENRDRAGRRCGKRSAWSKAGGYHPICYPDEVSDDMINQWISRHG